MPFDEDEFFDNIRKPTPEDLIRQQEESEEEPKDPFEDFDTDLFTQTPKMPEPAPEDLIRQEEESQPDVAICPFYPCACDKVGTSRCDKTCERNPDNYMDPKIKEVFEKEPWSNYCFNCGEFVPSRLHEDILEPPEVLGSHVVATGFMEYRTKLSKWTMERLTGKHEEDKLVDWKNQL